MTPADIAWIALCVVWAVGFFRNKRDARRPPIWWMAAYTLVLAIAFNLLFLRAARIGPLAWRILPDSKGCHWTGQVLQVAGLSFAIWARLHIGRNWSGMVTVKQDHTLVRSGPYGIVRHPIYAGLLLAILGNVVDHGNVAALLGFAILAAAWTRKLLLEERLMEAQFGDEYVRYRRKVKRLIPGVL